MLNIENEDKTEKYAKPPQQKYDDGPNKRFKKEHKSDDVKNSGFSDRKVTNRSFVYNKPQKN